MQEHYFKNNSRSGIMFIFLIAASFLFFVLLPMVVHPDTDVNLLRIIFGITFSIFLVIPVGLSTILASDYLVTNDGFFLVRRGKTVKSYPFSQYNFSRTHIQLTYSHVKVSKAHYLIIYNDQEEESYRLNVLKKDFEQILHLIGTYSGKPIA